ncbi:GntR family transcriptional regulator [Subtercola boreus]|uniref:GntR family transcriptional regulator n=1 Tax=Subtercola boreus TaxID=120213 RepID=UPI001559C5B0|nr:GntR family transcriptional regulator [Subtercola boreus]
MAEHRGALDIGWRYDVDFGREGAPVTSTFPGIPTPRRTTDDEDRIRSAVLRHVREAAENRRPLPGELELAATLGCSRQQLRHSLLELERSGILRRRQGAATTVDPVALRMSVRMEEQFEHAELLTRMGYTATVEVLSRSVGAIPVEVQALLESDPASLCLFTVKRWLADGVPAMVADDRLLLPPGMTQEPGGSVFSAAADVWGEPVIWEIATPGAAIVDERMSGLLALPLGSAVMTLEQIGVSASGRRLFHTVEYHRPGMVNHSLVRTVRPPWCTS